MKLFVRQKLLLAEPEGVVRNDFQIAVQEFLAALCLKAIRRDEKIPAAAGRTVSCRYAHLVIARLQSVENIPLEIPALHTDVAEGRGINIRNKSIL